MAVAGCWAKKTSSRGCMPVDAFSLAAKGSHPTSSQLLNATVYQASRGIAGGEAAARQVR